MTDFESRQQQIQEFMDDLDLDALLLQRVSSFAWATCGAAAYVNTASSTGAASLLITGTSRHLITNNIEAPRLIQEEHLNEQGWIIHAPPWYETNSLIADLTKGKQFGSDMNFPNAIELAGPIARLRARLNETEAQRFRSLGQICADAMSEAIHAVRPGQTEFEIAGILSAAAEKRGAQAVVNLIATDERILRFRHPLPTSKKLDRYAMLVLCGRKWGLVCSITRMVHFGTLPSELRHKMEATAQVDATFIHATRPGATVSDIFRKAQNAYATTGYANEWQLHHQGGPAGYEPREFIATPDMTEVVSAPQAYAWNPSITGVKSEDTILVTETSTDGVTHIAGWPTIPVTVDGVLYERPAILEIV
jgi:antitoxin VapB